MLEPDWDSDIWADNDEDCHGPVDTPENQHDHPEGFIWTCCDKLGDEPGCRIGFHKSAKDRRGPPGVCRDESSDESADGTSQDEDEDDEEDDEEDDY